MSRSLGNKRNEIGEGHIETITRLYGDFKQNEFTRIYDNSEFGYWQITVERPLRDENGSITACTGCVDW